MLPGPTHPADVRAGRCFLAHRELLKETDGCRVMPTSFNALRRREPLVPPTVSEARGLGIGTNGCTGRETIERIIQEGTDCEEPV